MSNPDSLTSAVAAKRFTSFVADINLHAEVPTAGAAKGAPARRLRIEAVGASPAIAVQFADGSSCIFSGLVANEVFDVQISKILTTGTTGVTSVTVFW